jgi:hypothetical protein
MTNEFLSLTKHLFQIPTCDDSQIITISETLFVFCIAKPVDPRIVQCSAALNRFPIANVLLQVIQGQLFS